MNAQANATSINDAKYVRISQVILDWHIRRPMTVAAILETAEDLNKLDRVAFFDEEPPLAWGSGVYRISEDGSLTLLKSKFDTSD